MPGNLIRKLDEGLSRLGPRLDGELPAFMVSLTLHAVLLVLLALVGHRVHQVAQREFRGQFPDSALGDMAFQDLDQGPEPPSNIPAAGSFAPNLDMKVTSAPSAIGVRPVSSEPANVKGTPLDLTHLDIRRATELVVPSASLLSHAVSIKGNGTEHVGGVEGAVDRIAVEILRRLEQGRTLVVWAFDASSSLRAERERLVKHIPTVYTHINQLDEKRLAADNGLLTLVVSYGKGREAMTPAPTGEVSEILQAIEAIPADESGVENTFTTVAEIIGGWGRYKDSSGRPYHPMIIVVTDEVGDDEDQLEVAIDRAQKTRVPVYVLGSQAIFGRTEGYMDYMDPKTKRMYYGLPVRQGPESADLEQIRLPFWYGGPQFDILDAGFGPFALSRLSSATGGIYFVARLNGQRMGFDPARMKEYRPDWTRRDQYDAAVNRSPLRQAVRNASLVTQQRLPGMPSLMFPSMDSPEFKDFMAANQALAERTAYTVDEALGPINAVAKLRDKEPSRRWQAHYDLIRGRLLAMKVRCYEYNWACARLKNDPPKFTNPRFNAWRLVPDTAVQYSDKAAAAAQEAERLLQRVVQEHPDTPWSLLAQRELRYPLGFRWMETYVTPSPRPNNDAAEAAQRKNRNTERPAEPPKL